MAFGGSRKSPMNTLLFVTSSVFGAESKTRQIGAEFVAAWRRAVTILTFFP
jgi:FMN-dependent NADH-azoreductase